MAGGLRMKEKGRRQPILGAKSNEWVVRPTTAKAVSGLVNHLNTRLDWYETDVLDLFAGTGSLGLACLNRGARRLMSVDGHPAALRHLNGLRDRSSDPRWSVVQADLLTPNDRPLSLPFGLILADPPYGDARQEGLVERILDGGLLISGGLLVVEHAITYRRFSLRHQAQHELTYGLSRFCIFENN
jgi:16S rRNA (guanine966-N2)-methyltransferase